MRIRDFRIEDYDAVIGLWTEAGLPFRSEGRDRREAIARELEDRRSLFLVAEGVAGCGRRLCTPTAGRLGPPGLAVAPDAGSGCQGARRRG
jgi:hypothetical protein